MKLPIGVALMAGGRVSVQWILAVAAVMIAGIMFTRLVPFEHINPDTAQHVSVARNLLAGEGLSTGILYYEEQYASGALPAQQTLWPPGYPILIAMLAGTGVSEVAAAFFLAFVGHLGIAFMLFLLVRRMNLSVTVATGLGLGWLILAAPGMLPLTAFTEPVFTLFTLASLYALILGFDGAERHSPLRWLLLAGAFSAAAFLIRYIGITFIAAIAAYLGSRFLVAPSKRRFLEVTVFAAIPVLVCAVIFGRNLLLSGDVTGGPAVDLGVSSGEVLKSLYWGSLAALGLFGASSLRTFTEALLLLWGLAAGLAVVPVLLGRSRSDVRMAAPVTLISLLYCGVTALLLVMIALGRSADSIQWRYLVPLLPFLMLTSAVAGKEIAAKLRIRSVRLLACVLGAIGAVSLIASQWQAVRGWDSFFVNARSGRELQAALSVTVPGSATVRELLGRTSPDDVILTQDGQSLGALLRQPVLGLASPYYTSRIWSREAVEGLVSRYQVDWVLFFPGLFFPEGNNDSNKVFFQELARGDIPAWLVPVHRSPDIELYSVDWALFNRTPLEAR